jgi:hypothetical protein
VWVVVETVDAVHLVPAGEPHELHVACTCVPAIVAVDGCRVGLVSHRDAPERALLGADRWAPTG